MRLPNLIIIGTPKSGTSSLFDWLALHPDVAVSRVKETRFFLDDGYPLKPGLANFNKHGLAAYGEFFTKDAESRSIVLEATPDYLYQRCALAQIPSLSDNIKVIVVLRKPSARIYSLYQYAVNNIGVIDKSMSFTAYVAAIMAGKGVGNFILDSAIKHSTYVDWLAAWAKVMPSERLLIGLFEEMQQAPREFMMQISRQVGLDADFYINTELGASNTTYQVRSQALHRIARPLARAIGTDNPVIAGLKKVYLSMNARMRKPAISAEDRRTLRELDALFADSNMRLEQQFGLSVSQWWKAH